MCMCVYLGEGFRVVKDLVILGLCWKKDDDKF